MATLGLTRISACCRVRCKCMSCFWVPFCPPCFPSTQCLWPHCNSCLYKQSASKWHLILSEMLLSFWRSHGLSLFPWNTQAEGLAACFCTSWEPPCGDIPFSMFMWLFASPNKAVSPVTVTVHSTRTRMPIQLLLPLASVPSCREMKWDLLTLILMFFVVWDMSFRKVVTRDPCPCSSLEPNLCRSKGMKGILQDKEKR